MESMVIQKLVFWSGIGHFALCAGSVFIPGMLQWKNGLKDLQPFFRQMFWTYAAYILAINFSFGFISVFATDELLNHSFLASSVSLFICIYWIGRIIVQFFFLDKSVAPKGWVYTIGEIALVTCFVSFAFTFLLAFCFNLHWV